MNARLSALVLTVSLALFATGARAQTHVEGTTLFPYPTRPDGVQPLVVTVTPVASARADLVVKVQTSWPEAELAIRHAVQVNAGALRTYVIPAPLGTVDYGSVALGEGTSATTLSLGGGGPSPAADPTYIGVVGLGVRIAAALNAVNPSGNNSGTATILAAAGATSPQSGDPILPTVPSAYGGAHALVAGAGSLLAAPPEAKRALSDWVLAGGFLAVSPRTVADLRDPWLRAMLGDVTDDGEGSLRGARLTRRAWGYAAQHGLGAVCVIPYDLSREGWAQEPGAEQALREFARSMRHVGGGMVAPGDLSLFRRFTYEGRGQIEEVFRPRQNIRPLLIPVTLLLTLYIIAVGVLFRRSRKAPLRVFVRVPLAALAVLALSYGATRLFRDHTNAARVLAVYDLGDGSSRGVERVFAGLTAGSSMTLSVAPPGEGFALLKTSSNHSAMRWDGRKLSVERARLSVWETGMLYTETMVDAGGGVHVRWSTDGKPTVENRTPWALRDATLFRAQGGGWVNVWDFPAVAPGATVEGALSLRDLSGQPSGPLLRVPFAEASVRPAAAFVDDIAGDAKRVFGCDQLFATFDLPERVGGLVRGMGFSLAQREALLRVVVPRTVEGDARYSGRIGAHRYGYEDLESVAEVVGDAAVTGDATPEGDAVSGDAGGDR